MDSLFQLQRAACHAKAAETKGHQRDARGTPGRTSDPLAMDIVPRLPRKSGGDQGTPEGRQRDARAYIRPLSNGHCPTPATQKRQRPRDTSGTPEGRQRDARAYIRPLSNGHCPTPATQKRRRPRDTRGTPEGRQGVHPTPWQWTLPHACHAKAAETKRHQRDARGTPGRKPGAEVSDVFQPLCLRQNLPKGCHATPRHEWKNTTVRRLIHLTPLPLLRSVRLLSSVPMPFIVCSETSAALGHARLWYRCEGNTRSRQKREERSRRQVVRTRYLREHNNAVLMQKTAPMKACSKGCQVMHINWHPGIFLIRKRHQTDCLLLMENSQEIRTLQLFSSVVASMKQAASLPNQHQQTAGRCTKEANVKNHPEISYLNLTQNI